MNLIELDKKLQSEFALKKSHADNIANENLQKARQNSNFVELEILERETTFELGKAEFKKRPKKEINDLKNTLIKIQEYKSTILKSLGLSLEDLKPKYSCQKCKDTGVFDGKSCECYTKRRNEEIIKDYELNTNDASFENIDTNLFEKDELENFLKLKNLLEKWCNNFPNITKKTIVLSGQTGVGKTYLAKCMSKRLIEQNFTICYISAFEMNNLMLKFHTTFDTQKYQNLIPLLESDVLFIDDLGSEPIINNVTINYLFNVLSEREERQKSTVITTNLSIEDINARYKDRICSRLSNKKTGKIFNIQGSDLRKKK